MIVVCFVLVPLLVFAAVVAVNYRDWMKDAEKVRGWWSKKADEWMRLHAVLFDAIRKHHRQRGQARCWENDAELYRAAGLDPGEPQLPPIEDHRKGCDQYRAAEYGVPVEDEPGAVVEKLRAEVERLRRRTHEIQERADRKNGKLERHRNKLLKALAACQADGRVLREENARLRQENAALRSGQPVDAERSRAYIEACAERNHLREENAKLKDELEAAEVAHRNAGSEIAAAKLREVAEQGRADGAFGGTEMEAAARKIEALREQARDWRRACEQRQGVIAQLQADLNQARGYHAVVVPSVSVTSLRTDPGQYTAHAGRGGE